MFSCYKVVVILLNLCWFGTGAGNETCLAEYNYNTSSRNVPPRDYLYFHERAAQKHNEAITSHGDTAPQFRLIVGGNQISIADAPYAVLYGMYCGGSLLAPNWVITAAHCREKDTFVIAGATRRSQGTHYPICAHFTHPNWTTPNKLHSHDFDYQLILLKTPVPVTDESRPIAIGSLIDMLPGADLFVSGWGHVRFAKGSRMEDRIRGVHIPLRGFDECVNLPYAQYHKMTPRMFCAGNKSGKQDACQGDSGGPVVSNHKLIGSVSFGIGCALPDRPGVYANLPIARPWIREITGLPL